MDLEEHSLESVSERCEECGAKLTGQEIERERVGEPAAKG